MQHAKQTQDRGHCQKANLPDNATKEADAAGEGRVEDEEHNLHSLFQASGMNELPITVEALLDDCQFAFEVYTEAPVCTISEAIGQNISKIINYINIMKTIHSTEHRNQRDQFPSKASSTEATEIHNIVACPSSFSSFLVKDLSQ